jgi:hypothetical protein
MGARASRSKQPVGDTLERAAGFVHSSPMRFLHKFAASSARKADDGVIREGRFRTLYAEGDRRAAGRGAAHSPSP